MSLVARRIALITSSKRIQMLATRNTSLLYAVERSYGFKAELQFAAF